MTHVIQVNPRAGVKDVPNTNLVILYFKEKTGRVRITLCRKAADGRVIYRGDERYNSFRIDDLFQEAGVDEETGRESDALESLVSVLEELRSMQTEGDSQESPKRHRTRRREEAVASGGEQKWEWFVDENNELYKRYV